MFLNNTNVMAACKARRLDLERLEERSLPSALVVGPNLNITKAPGNQAESTISIDPTNPSWLFEADSLSTVAHRSTDGGATWTTSVLNYPLGSAGDVQSAWDSYGNLFVVRLLTRAIAVGLSTDGGASFQVLSVPALVGIGFDQPKIAVGPGSSPGTGSVWVSSTNVYNQMVVTGAAVTGLGAVGSWNVSGAAPGPGDFGSIAVGPAGQVMIDYQNPLGGSAPYPISVNLDPGGLASFGLNPAVIATTTNVGPFTSIPAQPVRTIDAEAKLAWDRSGGPHNGRVYMVYTDRADTTTASTQIYVRYSDDNGSTWSAPTRVNDDPVGNGKSHFLPAIAVDQVTGDVGVTWYDSRNSDATNATTQVFGTASLDGGATWLPNVQISAGTSNASVVDPSFNYGDYDTMDFHNGAMYRTWADNSNSTGDNPDGTKSLDIYTAAVSVISLPADLGVKVSGPVGTRVEGDPLTYTLTVTNAGPDAAQNVSLIDALGGNLTFVSATTSQGTFAQSGGVILFDLGTIGAGQVVTATVNASSTEDGSLTDSAAVFSSTPDPNSSNNNATATTVVGEPEIDNATATTVVGEPEIDVSDPIVVRGKQVNSAALATFTHANGLEPPSAFLATIYWGDGTTSPGTISQSGSTYTVTGSHTYSKGNRHFVATCVTEVGTSPALLGPNGGPGSASVAAVAATPNVAAGVDLHAAAIEALWIEGASGIPAMWLRDRAALDLVAMSLEGINDPKGRLPASHRS
jgi:uncharacterized repeat protein (TIGR01451 family)